MEKFCERCGQNAANGHLYDVAESEFDGLPVTGTSLCFWCARHVGAVQRPLDKSVFWRRRDARLRAATALCFREFDLEMDLLDARSELSCPVRPVVVVWVSVDEYLETDPIGVEDICEGLQALHSKTSLTPACWGIPLATPVSDDDSQEPWSGGFADNH